MDGEDERKRRRDNDEGDQQRRKSYRPDQSPARSSGSSGRSGSDRSGGGSDVQEVRRSDSRSRDTGPVLPPPARIYRERRLSDAASERSDSSRISQTSESISERPGHDGSRSGYVPHGRGGHHNPFRDSSDRRDSFGSGSGGKSSSRGALGNGAQRPEDPRRTSGHHEHRRSSFGNGGRPEDPRSSSGHGAERRRESFGSSSSREGGCGDRPGPSRGGSIQDRFRQVAASSTVDLSLISGEGSDEGRPRGGGGRGRGRGGRGGRGGRRVQRPEKSDAERADFVDTRPREGGERVVKKAVAEKLIPLTDVPLVANYFPLISRHNWNLYHYHVTFTPEVERTGDKLFMFRAHGQLIRSAIGWYVFEGMALYTAAEIPPNMLEATVVDKNKRPHRISIASPPKVVAETDDVNIQIYNVIVRECLRALGLQEMGRYYYDPTRAVRFDAVRLQVWPGYKTSLRQHERQLLLCVEMTNKVLRDESALRVIQSAYGNREAIRNELLGSIVMTQYNNATYRIDDIKFDESPRKEFSKGKDQDGKETIMTLYEYYLTRYGIEIKDMNQPILYSKPKKKEIRRGKSHSIALIPELCLMTGLKDSQRKDFTLMRQLSETLHLPPNKRVQEIEGFYRKLAEKNIPETILAPAGLQLGTHLERIRGHMLPREKIYFRNDVQFEMNHPHYDWTMNLNSSNMCETVELQSWAVIAAPHDNVVTAFIQKIVENARRMGFRINERYTRLEATQNKGQQVRSFLEKIDQIVAQEKGRLQMVVCVLPNPDDYLYGTIKRKCYMELGIASQCILKKKMELRPGRESMMHGVAAKLAVQMNTKLGGVPWRVQIPMKGLMVIGFNISTSARGRGSNQGTSVGALVAGTNSDQTKYFSCVVEHGAGQSLSSKLGPAVVMALHRYSEANGNALPARIIFYRDGVGEGQLRAVNDTEVAAVREAIQGPYEKAKLEFPKFGFIVVTKRLNTKFFRPNPDMRARSDYQNPLPGTVVDDVVTLPERLDFYLVPSKGTGQGTISPVAFNILCNEMGLSPAKIQYLTFKLCHLYFNWSSTVSVPAPCQYAHKLAFLHNVITKSQRGEPAADATRLSNKLYYL